MKTSKIIIIILVVLDLGFLLFFAANYLNPFMLMSADQVYDMAKEEFRIGEQDTTNDKSIQKAVKFFNVAYEKGYKEKELFVSLYQCHTRLKDDAKAEEALNKAIELFPEDVELYFMRGEHMFGHRNWDAAYNDFNKSITLPFDSAEFDLIDAAYYNRGAIAWLKGDTAKANADYWKANALAGDTLNTYDIYCKDIKK